MPSAYVYLFIWQDGIGAEANKRGWIMFIGLSGLEVLGSDSDNKMHSEAVPLAR